MNAQHIVITHFSQRSGFHVPVYNEAKFPNVIVAYDHMQLRHATLPVASKTPAVIRRLLETDEWGGVDAEADAEL